MRLALEQLVGCWREGGRRACQARLTPPTLGRFARCWCEGGLLVNVSGAVGVREVLLVDYWHSEGLVPLELVGVEYDGEGAVVYERHFHHGAEFAGGYVRNISFGALDERLIEGAGRIRGSCFGKRRAVSALAVGVERELRHHEHFPVDVGNGAVGLPRVIFEDAHLEDLTPQALYLAGSVFLPDAEQDKVSASDRACGGPLDADAGLSYSLDDCAHGVSFRWRKFKQDHTTTWYRMLAT